MQICTLTQTHNHNSIPPLSFFRPDALPATQPTASNKALKAKPDDCLLFAAHAHTIKICFAVVPRLCHLILVSVSTLYLQLLARIMMLIIENYKVIRITHLQCMSLLFQSPCLSVCLSRVRSSKLNEICAEFRRLYRKSRLPSKNMMSDFALKVAKFPKIVCEPIVSLR